MNLYINVSGGRLELPVPSTGIVRTVYAGESFVGSSEYDRYVAKGLLAQVRDTSCTRVNYVDADDVDDSSSDVEDSVAPFRYKVNDAASQSSLYKPKALLRFDQEIRVGENMMVIYYFYTAFDTCSSPSHSVQTYETYSGSWSLPTWADLPSNFYTLDPKKQIDALMTRV
jgi:hypothetical protein